MLAPEVLLPAKEVPLDTTTFWPSTVSVLLAVSMASTSPLTALV